MKSVKKIIYILSTSVVLVIILSIVFNKGYRKLYQPTYNTLHMVFDDTISYNTLLIGNSKVAFGLNPLYIDSIAQLNAINLGYAAANLPTYDLLLSAYLNKHQAPRFLVMGIENNLFFTDEDHCNKLPLYDYLYREDVATYFEHLKLPYRLQRWIPGTKFMYMDDYSRFGILNAFRGKSLFQQADIYHYKGFYISKNDQKGLQFVPVRKVDTFTQLNQKALEHFEHIVSICTKHHITLLLCFPPMPHQVASISQTPLNLIVEKYLQKQQTFHPFHVLHNDTNRTFAPAYFVDGSHLTYDGSIKYSILIAEYLRHLNTTNEGLK